MPWGSETPLQNPTTTPTQHSTCLVDLPLLPPCVQVAGLFSGTPVALTGLGATQLVLPATLPQVLGILAFVYAGGLPWGEAELPGGMGAGRNKTGLERFQAQGGDPLLGLYTARTHLQSH